MAWHLLHCKAFMSSVITTPQPLHDIIDCLGALTLLVICAREEEAVASLPFAAGLHLPGWLLPVWHLPLSIVLDVQNVQI